MARSFSYLFLLVGFAAAIDGKAPAAHRTNYLIGSRDASAWQAPTPKPEDAPQDRHIKEYWERQ
ncbi:MAG: hypothetical protein Q3X95_09030 [Duodenibacillus sp.]|nr:hypothetical protein [Duodenibacillus sp.]